MKRTYLILLLTTLAFGAAKTTVAEVNGSTVRVVSGEGFRAGESAFIMREFDTDHGSVIAQCTVDATDTAKLECRPFDYLYHESLTLVKSDVKQGDTVVEGLLNESVSIIAPTQKAYLAVKAMYPDAIIFHPDLMAVTLKYDDNPTPEKEDFQTFCKDNFIGELLFALNDGLYEVDCLSFRLIGKKAEHFDDKENDKPFYHRVGEIERGFFDFSSDAVDDFTAYYKKMIGVE